MQPARQYSSIYFTNTPSSNQTQCRRFCIWLS